MTAFESVSTWKTTTGAAAVARPRGGPLWISPARICARSPRRLRVAVDGRTGAGKSTFADELAAAVRVQRPVDAAARPLDDFKKPWRDGRAEKGYDRLTGEGYYRNAHDFDAARGCCSSSPPAPTATVGLRLSVFDPLTGADHRETVIAAPAGRSPRRRRRLRVPARVQRLLGRAHMDRRVRGESHASGA